MAAVLFAPTGSMPAGVVEKAELALRVLRLRHPEVNWRGAPLQAELTGDGSADLAVVGTDPETLIVALIVWPWTVIPELCGWVGEWQQRPRPDVFA